MLKLVAILLLSVVVNCRHRHKNRESDDANFQDAVESIARQSIEKIFQNKAINGQDPESTNESSRRHNQPGRRHRKHHLKSTLNQGEREEPKKAYSSEDQSLYDGNPYQDLYRHLPILQMMPVPLFYEGEDYSGDDQEIASGDEVPTDIKLESSIKGDNDESRPAQAAEEANPESSNEGENHVTSKQRTIKKRHGKHHHKKQHVLNAEHGRTHKLNKEFHQALISGEPLKSTFHSGKLPSSFGSLKGRVSSHGLKSHGHKKVKAFMQPSSVPPQGNSNTNIFSNSNSLTPSNGGMNSQTAGLQGSTFNQYPNKMQGMNSNSFREQAFPNPNPMNSIFPNQALQGNQIDGNQFSNPLQGLNNPMFGSAVPSYGGQQQNLLSPGGLSGVQTGNTQPNNLLGSQGTENNNNKNPDGTCIASCPAACAPKCSDACCHADLSTISNLLQSSCPQSCAPLYSPTCCNSAQYQQQQPVTQFQMPCQASCAPQYLPSCCGTAPPPTFQMPFQLPQTMCPSNCAPDYSASCCGGLQSPIMPFQAPQNPCQASCAPQYLPSCCNEAPQPPQQFGQGSCSPTCAPSYLPSCCLAEVPQTPSPPPSCPPSCAPQYTPLCCSSNIGYGLPTVQAAPPPPPLQVRVGFKAGYLPQRAQSSPCPESCSTQCLKACPTNCCGVAKKSVVAPHPMAMPQPSRPLILPAFKPIAAKRVVAKQPVVKAPATRQMPQKAPALKPFSMKMSPNAPPNPLNWDKK